MSEELVKIVFGGDTSPVQSALRGLRGQAQEALKGIGELIMAPLAGAGLAETFSKVAEKMEAIQRSAEATGMSVREVQEFGKAAREVGLNAEQAERPLEKLAENIGAAGEGSKEAEEKFKKWGVVIKDAAGNLMSTQFVLDQIADKMASASSEATQTAMAIDLLGKSGAKLVGVLGEGSGALHERGKGGAIFSEEDISMVKGAKDAVVNMGEGISSWLIKPLTFITGGAARRMLRESTEEIERTTERIAEMGAETQARMNEGKFLGDVDPANSDHDLRIQKEIVQLRGSEQTHIQKGLALLDQIAALKTVIAQLDKTSNLYKSKSLDLTLLELQATKELTAAHEEQKADRKDVSVAMPGPGMVVRHYDPMSLYEAAGYDNVHVLKSKPIPYLPAKPWHTLPMHAIPYSGIPEHPPFKQDQSEAILKSIHQLLEGGLPVKLTNQ